MNHKRNSRRSDSYDALTRVVEPRNECVSVILSALLGDGCVATPIVAKAVAGAHFPKEAMNG